MAQKRIHFDDGTDFFSRNLALSFQEIWLISEAHGAKAQGWRISVIILMMAPISFQEIWPENTNKCTSSLINGFTG